MNKARRLIEIMWIIVAAVCAIEGYVSYRNVGLKNEKTLVLIGAFVVAIAMYTLRKRQNAKLKERDDLK